MHRFEFFGLMVLVALMLVMRRSFLLMSICALIGFGYAEVRVGRVFEDRVNQHYNQEIESMFTIVSDPEDGLFNQRAVIRANGLPADIAAQLPLYPKFKNGDKFHARLVLEEPPQLDDFDYKLYLNTQGIYFTGRIRQLSYKPEVGLPPNLPVQVRQEVKRFIFRHIGYESGGLLSGLIIGTRENLSEMFTANLQATGTTHIVAVSGYNVSLVIGMLLNLAGLVKRQHLLLFCLVAVFIFVSIVGFSNLPALRAGLMGFVLIAAFLSGRRYAIIFSLCYAVLFMLLINPLVWLSVSFQLSVLAFMGLFLFSEPFVRLLEKLPLNIGENIGTTLAVLLLTLPITVNTFGTTSLISPLVNALILPIVPIITIMGIGSLALSLMHPLLGAGLLTVTEILLELVIGIINVFGSLPGVVTNSQMLGLLINIVIALMFISLDFYFFRKKLYDSE